MLGSADIVAIPKGNVREALLAATSELMTERETLDISLSDIAKKVGVTPAMVKYHFGNKDGLLMALLERDVGASIDGLVWLLGVQMSLVSKMRNHLSALADAYIKYPYLNKLLLLMISDASSDYSKIVTDRFIKPVVNAYEIIIETGIASGEFKSIDPMMFYFTTIGACENLFSSRFILSFLFNIVVPDEQLRRRQKAHFIESVMAGLVA